MSNALSRARHALADDHRPAVGGDDGAVRERQTVGRDTGRPVGFDGDQARVARLLAAVHVEAEVADVGPARCVDDHVVALPGRERGEVGVRRSARRRRTA